MFATCKRWVTKKEWGKWIRKRGLDQEMGGGPLGDRAWVTDWSSFCNPPLRSTNPSTIFDKIQNTNTIQIQIQIQIRTQTQTQTQIQMSDWLILFLQSSITLHKSLSFPANTNTNTNTELECLTDRLAEILHCCSTNPSPLLWMTEKYAILIF